MNKTVSIALAGFSFVIEENAYIKLNDYLQALRRSLEKDEEDEVMYDIEIRITEIFKANMEKREVVNLEDVEKVIAQIGTPEVIEGQEESYSHKNNEEKRQLFRDVAGAKIAGVCSGFAHYLGVNVVVMRIIWLLSFFVTGFFPLFTLYIILALAMPKAETTSDILKMKGKPMDFENIKEESMRFANESGQKIGTFFQENKPTMMKNGDRFLGVLLKIGGVVMALVAIGIAITGIFIILGMFGLFEITGMNHMDFLFEEDAKYILIAIIFLIVAILTIIFSAFSVKLFLPKTKIRNFGYVVLVLFIALIGTSVAMGMKTSELSIFYTGENYEEENIEVRANENKIEIDLKRVNIPENFKAYGRQIFSDKNRVFEYDRPDIEIIRRVGIEKPYLVLIKEAKGYNHAMRLNVPVEVRSGRILFPNYISYPYEHRLRDYEVEYHLVVPMDMQVIDQSQGKLRIDHDADGDFDGDDWDDKIEIDMPRGTIKIN